MFQEYVDEISDPKHREEYEQYLAQLEKEEKVPEDMELIRPKPGFCIKTLSNEAEEKDAKKVFINICHSEKVEKATMESSKEGQNWSVPNTMGPPRMEKDNSECGALWRLLVLARRGGPWADCASACLTECATTND